VGYVVTEQGPGQGRRAGAQNVTRLLLAIARRPPRSVRMVSVNGAPGLVMRDADGVLTVIAFTVDAGRITALDVMRNPDKLTTVPGPWLSGPALTRPAGVLRHPGQVTRQPPVVRGGPANRRAAGG
jgi:hypothetical protein